MSQSKASLISILLVSKIKALALFSFREAERSQSASIGKTVYSGKEEDKITARRSSSPGVSNVVTFGR